MKRSWILTFCISVKWRGLGYEHSMEGHSVYQWDEEVLDIDILWRDILYICGVKRSWIWTF
jgi:hypothetical protein